MDTTNTCVVDIKNQILEFCNSNNYKLNIIEKNHYLIETEEYYIFLFLDIGVSNYYYCTYVYFVLKYKKILIGELIKIEDKYFNKLSLTTIGREESIVNYFNNIEDKIEKKLNSSILAKKCFSCKELIQFCYCKKSFICNNCNKPYFLTYSVLKNNKLYQLPRNNRCQDCAI